MTIHPYTRLFTSASTPTVNDDITLGYEVGDVWHHASGSVYDCRDNTDGAAVWDERGAGAGSVDSVNGDTGTVIVDYASVSGADAGTDVTGAELEELSDGSETTLHSHAGIGGTAFQRVLSSDLTLADGECLVLSGYIDDGGFTITTDGDSVLEVL